MSDMAHAIEAWRRPGKCDGHKSGTNAAGVLPPCRISLAGHILSSGGDQQPFVMLSALPSRPCRSIPSQRLCAHKAKTMIPLSDLLRADAFLICMQQLLPNGFANVVPFGSWPVPQALCADPNLFYFRPSLVKFRQAQTLRKKNHVRGQP
jgi:hypothetical protein